MARFRETVWRDGNHMLFESGHKTFDNQVDCISTGNVIGHVQLSFHVRAYTETECNGFVRPPGHLRSFDMKKWRLPTDVRDRVLKETETTSVWLYEFRHWTAKGKIVHGYVITSNDHELLAEFVTGPTYKSGLVINEAVTYVTARERR